MQNSQPLASYKPLYFWTQMPNDVHYSSSCCAFVLFMYHLMHIRWKVANLGELKIMQYNECPLNKTLKQHQSLISTKDFHLMELPKKPFLTNLSPPREGPGKD
ncbi:CLUMA_CG001146, isoform A [Clunio marinus]|uniref:CLUMA_CG001146, isoform A n=1 Tax=Clunio marinus TaxID=568069 RepID=A0A1J1HH46_9DIPT|nr:CLUMA_CG001146, isoform A [Clunio marinus]